MNTFNGFISIFNRAKDKIIELKSRPREFIQTETWEKNGGKVEQRIQRLCDNLWQESNKNFWNPRGRRTGKRWRQKRTKQRIEREGDESRTIWKDIKNTERSKKLRELQTGQVWKHTYIHSDTPNSEGSLIKIGNYIQWSKDT